MTAPDDEGADRHSALPYGERHAWGYLTTALAVPIVYFAIMLGRLSGTTADDVEFQVPLLIAVGASILLNAFLAPAPRKGRDRRDERDRFISRRGERAAFYTLAVAMIAPLALAMLEAPYFWIANAAYLAFVCSAVADSVAKLVGYRRGC